MPYELTTGQLLGGYNAFTVKEGEQATLIVREFISSDETELFKSRMDGLPRIILSYLPQDEIADLLPVKHMVAILRKDMSVTLHLDKEKGGVRSMLDVKMKRAVEKDEDIFLDDIADAERLRYEGIDFPTDAGVMIVFWNGERYGFFYDLAPLHEEREAREFDIEVLMGYYFCYLSQPHMFGIDDKEWKFMFDSQWFPFITLTVKTRSRMIEAARNKSSIDDLLTDIAEEVSKNLDNIKARVRKHSFFSKHSMLIEHALGRFAERDYISATCILFTRIEGVMRSLHQATTSTGKITQSTLSSAAIEARGGEGSSGFLLLPVKFREYLESVYFAGFDPNSDATLSRHSVSHGVAQQADFNQKAATLGVLIIDQISYFLPDEKPSS